MHWMVAGSIGLVIGLLIGLLIGGIVLLLRRNREQASLHQVRAQNDALQQDVEEERQRTQELRAELAQINHQREQAQNEAVRLSEQLKSRDEQFQQQKQLLEQAEQRLAHTFSSLGSKALAVNSEEFIKLAKQAFQNLLAEAKGDVDKKQQAIDNLVKPIRDLLEKQTKAIGEIENKREGAYAKIEEQIKHIASAHESLNKQTSKLVTALRRPEQRGRWGEVQLRNAVELAGMSKHCDFCEQPQTDDPSTRDRPDMTINLPGGGVIVADSKVALDAYLDALECDDNETRAECFRRHARQIEQHYKRLSQKQYWDQFDRTPKIVIMFIPLESALTAALEEKPDLHHDAMQQHVLIATPTLLIALLRAVAYGWQQEALAENAREISMVGKELYDRLSTFAGHFERIGKNLRQSTEAYNKAVGSMERMVLPSTRKLKELHATTDDDIEPPALVDREVRDITSDELQSSPPLPGSRSGASDHNHHTGGNGAPAGQ